MIIGTVRQEEARVFDDYAGYHQFHAEETQEPCGSFEVFWLDTGDLVMSWEDEENNWPHSAAAGWYWAAGFPGCLWDGEPMGPFASSRQALKDADEWHPEFD